jgi:hypothetical protein
MCAQKAKFLHEALDWKMNGWMTRFKQQYGIHEIAIQGERFSVNDAAADMFCIEFQKFVHEENLKPDEIYNADTPELYWKRLPTRTLLSERQKRVSGHKSSKERLMVMCCGNASGNHKLKLAVIGKAKKP